MEYKGKNLVLDKKGKELINRFNWWWINSNPKGVEKFYLTRQHKEKTVYFHRELMNALNGQIIDHKDGNTLNCRLDNLRIVTSTQNALNRKPRKNAKSKFKGVYKRKSGKFYSMFQTPEKIHYCGQYNTEEEAHNAYLKKRAELGVD